MDDSDIYERIIDGTTEYNWYGIAIHNVVYTSKVTLK